MFPSLEQKLERYVELEKQMVDPDVLANVEKMLEIQKEMGGLAKVAAAVREYHELQENIEAAQMMVDEEDDADSKAYAQEELNGFQSRSNELATELEDLATAGDSITRGSLIMEIRSGTGGDEAALFAKDLYDMYMKFCETKSWKVELLEFAGTELGGVSKVVCSITGEGAFHQLQFEQQIFSLHEIPQPESFHAALQRHQSSR